MTLRSFPAAGRSPPDCSPWPRLPPWPPPRSAGLPPPRSLRRRRSADRLHRVRPAQRAPRHSRPRTLRARVRLLRALPRRQQERAARPHRLRALLRAPHVRGHREHPPRPDLQGRDRRRRQPQRLHLLRPDRLLHQPAQQPVRPRAVDRERAHDARQDRADRRRHPAPGRQGGTAAALRQPALRWVVRGSGQARVRGQSRMPGCPSAACSTSTRPRWRSSASSTRPTTCPTTPRWCSRATSTRRRSRARWRRTSAPSRAGRTPPGQPSSKPSRARTSSESPSSKRMPTSCVRPRNRKPSTSINRTPPCPPPCTPGSPRRKPTCPTPTRSRCSPTSSPTAVPRGCTGGWWTPSRPPSRPARSPTCWRTPGWSACSPSATGASPSNGSTPSSTRRSTRSARRA